MRRKILSNVIDHKIGDRLTKMWSVFFMACWHVNPSMFEKLKWVEKSLVTLSTIISAIGGQNCEVKFSCNKAT